MLLTRLVNRRSRFVFFGLAACSAVATLVSGSSPGRQIQTAVLDLTGEVPRDEQGYYHGIPGMSGGGGAWRPGPGDTVKYHLPLTAEIVGVSANKDGNFVIEVSLRNTDSAPFDLPSSSKLTTIEKPGNKSRRVFFFQLQPLGGRKASIVALGSAATAGSTNLPESFVRLDPGNSLKILLLASSDLISRSFGPQSEELAVKVICNEWRLDDNRFFLNGISDELTSVNKAQFAIRHNQVVYLQP